MHFCFSTATTVTRTRLDVTLYVHCLSCLIKEMEVFGNQYHEVAKKNSCTFQGSNSGSRIGFNVCSRCLIRCCFIEAISLTKSFVNREVFGMISPLTFRLSGGPEPRKFEPR